MLGGEQDCYGGCTDSSQSFYGLMDEVWLRAQAEVLHAQRCSVLNCAVRLLAAWRDAEMPVGLACCVICYLRGWCSC
jgi:hypothetical protein